ncbi:MAG: LptA/OstA family protein [Anaerovibrio sp.]|nr:LptA/OstA family protein [Selenomonadaceae bacterium]MDY6053718.1 LptA/OstA family protein [Anaerovibrio sp.]
MLKKLQPKKILLLTAAISLLSTGMLFAAEEAPTSLDGDTVEYDMETGIIKAQGDVLMIRGDAKVTGNEAEYNSKTKEGKVVGNVIAVQKNARVTAQQVTSDANQHMIATGNVHGTMDDKTFIGEQVDYFQPDEYVLIENRGTITSKDGSFTADTMEGYLKEEHLIGTGNVYVDSPVNSLIAGGDLLNYYGANRGEAILTGNAWAVQHNNRLKSHKLTLHLAQNGKSTVSE